MTGTGSWSSVLLFLSAVKALPRVVVPIQVSLQEPAAKNGRVVVEAAVELAALRFRSDLPEPPYDAFTWDPPAPPPPVVPSAFAFRPVGVRDPFATDALRTALDAMPPAAVAQQCGEHDLVPAGDALKEFELDALSVAFACAAGQERKAVFVAAPHRCLVAGLGTPVGRGGGKVQNVAGGRVTIVETDAGAEGRIYPVYLFRTAAGGAPAWFCPPTKLPSSKGR